MQKPCNTFQPIQIPIILVDDKAKELQIKLAIIGFRLFEPAPVLVLD